MSEKLRSITVAPIPPKPYRIADVIFYAHYSKESTSISKTSSEFGMIPHAGNPPGPATFIRCVEQT